MENNCFTVYKKKVTGRNSDDHMHILCSDCVDINSDSGQITITCANGNEVCYYGEIMGFNMGEHAIYLEIYDLENDSHVHTHEDGTTHTHTHVHESKPHAHHHSPEVRKKQLNRIARAIGHSQHVKSMIANDEDCAAVLTQLSAVTSALRNLGKEIINEHMAHCISHAIEEGDTTSVEEFQEAVRKFI